MSSESGKQLCLILMTMSLCRASGKSNPRVFKGRDAAASVTLASPVIMAWKIMVSVFLQGPESQVKTMASQAEIGLECMPVWEGGQGYGPPIFLKPKPPDQIVKRKTVSFMISYTVLNSHLLECRTRSLNCQESISWA